MVFDAIRQILRIIQSVGGPPRLDFRGSGVWGGALDFGKVLDTFLELEIIGPMNTSR